MTNMLGRLLLMTLMLSTTLGLGSQKSNRDISPDVSQLEYRLANQSDILIIPKENPEAAVFVALNPKDNVRFWTCGIQLALNCDFSMSQEGFH